MKAKCSSQLFTGLILILFLVSSFNQSSVAGQMDTDAVEESPRDHPSQDGISTNSTTLNNESIEVDQTDYSGSMQDNIGLDSLGSYDIVDKDSVLDTNDWYEGETVKTEFSDKDVTVKTLENSYHERYEVIDYIASTELSGSYSYDMIEGLDGYLYVVDSGNDRILQYQLDGTYITSFGSTGTGNGQFDDPRGLTQDSSGNFYVADTQNDRIQKFNSAFTYSSQWGSSGTGNGQFDRPFAIAIDEDDDIYVADTFNDRIQKFDSSGTYLTKWGSSGTGNGQFDYLWDLEISPEGYVVTIEQHIISGGGDRVQVFQTDGTFVSKFGSTGTGDSNFDDPLAIAFDSEGYLWVGDYANYRVKQHELDGTYIKEFGSSSELTTITSILWASNDRFYIIDGTEDNIRVIDLIQEQNYELGDLPQTDDSQDQIFTSGDNVNTLYQKSYTRYTLYDMIYPQTLTMVYSWDIQRNGVWSTIESRDTSISLDLSDTSIYGSSELYIEIFVTYGRKEYKVEISAYDTGILQDVSNSKVSSVAYSSFSKSRFKIDYIEASSYQISSQIKSNYHYSSPTAIVHTISFDVFDYRIPVAVYSPLDWQFSSINPQASVVWDSGSKTYNVTNTVPTIYTIRFLSNSSQFLAIDDVSSDYMQSPSFESGSNEDFTWTDSSSSNTGNSINTSIVFDGSFSYRLDEDSTSDYGDLNIEGDMPIPAGQYYLSFSIYVESHSDTEFRIIVSDGGSLSTSTYYDLPESNRWQTYFIYIDYDGSIGSSDRRIIFRFVESSETGIVFVDDFKIWKANGQADTSSYQQTTFSAQFISWDGYQNPVLQNLEVNFVLGDRTSQSYIISKTLFTDLNGFASYTFKGTLESKEYVIKWSSMDGYGILKYDNFDSYSTGSNPDDFEPHPNVINGVVETSNIRSYSGSNSYRIWASPSDSPAYAHGHSVDYMHDPTVEYKWNRDNSGASRVSLIETNAFDTSNNDYAGLFVSFPTGTSSGTPILYIDPSTTGTTVFNLGSFDAITISDDTWYDVKISLSGRKVKMWFDGSYIGAVTVSDTYDLFSAENAKLGFGKGWNSRSDYIDDLYYGSKGVLSYFTPIPSSSQPYSYEQNGLKASSGQGIKNYWDFSEGTTDYFSSTVGTSVTNENGYIEAYNATQNDYVWIRTTDTDFTIDTSFYTHYAVRIYVNNTGFDYFGIRVRNTGTAYVTISSSEFSTGWNLFYGVIDDSDWNGEVSDGLTLIVDQLTSPILVRYDFLYFTNSWDQGFSWEFEESNYQDTWEGYGGTSTISVSDGIITASRSAGTTVSIVNYFEFSYDTQEIQTRIRSVGQDLEFRIKYVSSGDTIIQSLNSDQWTTITFTTNEAWGEKSTLSFFLYDPSPSYPLEMQIDYIRFIDISAYDDLEIDSNTGLSYFDDGDNQTDYFKTWINGSNYGIYSEYELFYLPMQTSSTYSLTYTLFLSDVPQGTPQLANTICEYSYSVVEQFAVYIGDYDPGDTQISISVTATKSGTYSYYHNNTLQGAGSFNKDGTTITLNRDTTAGLYYELAVKFTNGSDNRWFNATISNPDEQALRIDVWNPVITLDYVQISVKTNIQALMNVTEDGVVKAAALNADSLTYSINTVPGLHNITVVVYISGQSIEIPFSYQVSVTYNLVIRYYNSITGLGIDFDTFKTYVNGSLLLDTLYEHTSPRINVTAQDFNGNYLKLNGSSTSYLVDFSPGNQTILVEIGVPIVNVQFFNEGPIHGGAVRFKVALNTSGWATSNSLNFTFVVLPQTAISYRLIAGNYSYTVELLNQSYGDFDNMDIIETSSSSVELASNSPSRIVSARLEVPSNIVVEQIRKIIVNELSTSFIWSTLTWLSLLIIGQILAHEFKNYWINFRRGWGYSENETITHDRGPRKGEYKQDFERERRFS